MNRDFHLQRLFEHAITDLSAKLAAGIDYESLHMDNDIREPPVVFKDLLNSPLWCSPLSNKGIMREVSYNRLCPSKAMSQFIGI